jgi:dTDP-4-dehydrorhamnose reductase
MRLLITGAKGRLGSKLVELAISQNHEVISTDLDELDITNAAAVSDLFAANKPQWVIHTAAWTDVDGCARDPEKANLINGQGSANVASAAQQVGAGIVGISTNEVFDGETDVPYRENDVTHPINPYGYSKWLGEQAVRQHNPHHMIVRTSWLFAHGGKNFIQTILNAADANKPLRVVTNEIANPTYNDDLAQGILRLLECDQSGIYHLVNEGYCSRWEFARYILDHAGYGATEVAKITSDEWNRPSTPPRFCPLMNEAASALGVTLRDWRSAVDVFLQREGLLKY